MNRPDGYRYIRQYWAGPKDRWGYPTDRENYALYEVRGGRACRVGTARSHDGYVAFLEGGAA